MLPTFKVRTYENIVLNWEYENQDDNEERNNGYKHKAQDVYVNICGLVWAVNWITKC